MLSILCEIHTNNITDLHTIAMAPLKHVIKGLKGKMAGQLAQTRLPIIVQILCDLKVV